MSLSEVAGQDKAKAIAIAWLESGRIPHAILVSGVVGVGHFVRVGAYSIVSGGSSLNQDVPPYGMVSGVPARLIGINRVGLQRSGFSSEERVAIRAAYGVLFRSEGPLEERLHSLRERFASSEVVLRLVEFIESSSKGVCRMRRRAI